MLQLSASYKPWLLRQCSEFVMGAVSSNNSLSELVSSTRPLCDTTFHVSTLLTFRGCASAIASGLRSSIDIPAACVMLLCRNELRLLN
jgi:hypothetical protein